MNGLMNPDVPAKCTGVPNTKPSHSVTFARKAFTVSSEFQHLKFCAHLPQPMQPIMALLPHQNSSVSIPAFSSSFATSIRAVCVQPVLCWLPFTINTFISLCLILYFRGQRYIFILKYVQFVKQ